MDTEKISNCLNSSQPWILEKIIRKTSIHKMSRIPPFCPICRESHYEKLKNQRSKAETEFAIRCMTYRLGNDINHSFHRNFCNFCKFVHNTSNTNKKWWLRWEHLCQILSRRVEQSHLTKESFARELVSNAPAQFFPNNAISYLTKILLEQLYLAVNCALPISESFYPSM